MEWSDWDDFVFFVVARSLVDLQRLWQIHWNLIIFLILQVEFSGKLARDAMNNTETKMIMDTPTPGMPVRVKFKFEG